MRKSVVIVGGIGPCRSPMRSVQREESGVRRLSHEVVVRGRRKRSPCEPAPGNREPFIGLSCGPGRRGLPAGRAGALSRAARATRGPHSLFALEPRRRPGVSTRVIEFATAEVLAAMVASRWRSARRIRHQPPRVVIRIRCRAACSTVGGAVVRFAFRDYRAADAASRGHREMQQPSHFVDRFAGEPRASATSSASSRCAVDPGREPVDSTAS